VTKMLTGSDVRRLLGLTVAALETVL
jgi:hypothetical protein